MLVGENISEIQPVVTKLRLAGIGGILDYAAEADVSGDKSSAGQAAMGQTRRPSATDSAEAALDCNLEVTIKAIESAAIVGGSAAIKVCYQHLIYAHVAKLRLYLFMLFNSLRVSHSPSSCSTFLAFYMTTGVLFDALM